MKVTCGTDIIEIDRIKDAIEKGDDKFINHVFTEKEIEYCESHKNQKYQHYAARFAAKEAGFKALGDYVENNDWKMYEVINVENGKPILNVKYDIEGLESVDISISHCRAYAVSTVVAVFEK